MSSVKLPRYLKWNGGKPRWEPGGRSGPAMRKAGFPGRSLRHPDGTWFSLAEAIAAAREINRQVDAWRAQGSPRRRAARPPAPPRERTLAALWNEYRASPRFSALRATTRRDYEGRARVFLAWAGDQPAAALDELALDAFYQRLRETRGPHQAAGVIAVLRVTLSHGQRIRWLSRNPARGMRVSLPRPRPVVWTPEEEAAIIETADDLGEHGVADAFMIALHTGQRAGDVRRVEAFFEVNGRLRLRVRQSKTGAMVDIPATAALAARLRAITARHRAAGLNPPALVLDDHTRRPFTRHGLSHRFAAIRAAACQRFPALAPSMRAKRFMHARHTCVTRLAEAGVDIAGISAIPGHSLQSVNAILEHYMARTGKLADMAIDALERSNKKA